MAERTRKTESRSGDRRANRTILGRTLFLMLLFGVVAFVPLFAKLYDLQIVQQKDLQSKALNQQTRDSLVAANRGTIYDTNGEVLAMSGTVYNVQMSPKDIVETQQSYADKVEAAMEKEGEARCDLMQSLEIAVRVRTTVLKDDKAKRPKKARLWKRSRRLTLRTHLR